MPEVIQQAAKSVDWSKLVIGAVSLVVVGGLVYSGKLGESSLIYVLGLFTPLGSYKLPEAQGSSAGKEGAK